MTLQELPILSVWHALGGGPLCGKRGRAFWRGGDSYSIALDATKGTWYDHRDGRGGGTLALAETALGCSRAAALRWLEENCGLDARRSFPGEECAQYATQIVERNDAKCWGIAARALAEEVLDQLEPCDPARVNYTRLLIVIRSGATGLIDEYATWLSTHPELTRAMVRAGASSQARIQRRLAFYLLELSNAA